MAQFLVTYHGMGHPDPEAMAAARAAFQSWVESVGDAVVDPGAPVSYVSQVADGAPAAIAEISGYSIIKAASVDEARTLLASHPFIARGGTLQIGECLGI